MSTRTLLLHVPVVHRGYLELFGRVGERVGALKILGDDIVARFRAFESDISSLSARDAERLVRALGFFPDVSVLSLNSVADLKPQPLMLVNDELSRRFAGELLPRADIEWESAFLRWDSSHVQRASPVNFKNTSQDPRDREFIAAAYAEAAKSGDWWRQVGAVLVREGEIVSRAYNRDMPDEHASYRFGNIRDYLKPGEQPEYSNTLHAENRIVAEAARAGMNTAGAHLYVTHFPCPLCAKAVTVAGIAKCFFGEGSASFDAEMIFSAGGVEIVFVPRDAPHA